MKRRGFLKALGIGAAAPMVAALPAPTREVTATPDYAAYPALMRRQIMDNIYLASNPRMTYDQYGDESLGIEYHYQVDVWPK